jgi:hypothetical protein
MCFLWGKKLTTGGTEQDREKKFYKNSFYSVINANNSVAIKKVEA